MDWKNEYRYNKGKLFAIGAGALVLALIAFSGLCWCALGLCSEYIAGIRFGYWEIFGVSGASFVGLLLIRPLGKRWLVSTPAPIDGAPPPESLAREPREEAGETGKWRDLYDQLSQEERKAFKALMGKYCSDAPSVEGSSPVEP